MTSATTQVRPSVVDDFVRNFLIKAGMSRSLECFNTEWYELKSKGKLPAELSSAVPDIYLRNEELDLNTRNLREQVEKMRQVANKAQQTWDKFRKERDFHRMHHKRVAQEKNKLLNDIKRLRTHLRSYEPMLQELKRKHEVAMKEKMLISLERDRLRLKVRNLEETAQSQPMPQQPQTNDERGKALSPTLKSARTATRSVRKMALIPVDDPSANPFLDLEFDPAPLDKFKERKAFRGHINSVSACAFHPKKPIIATASDDETWRLWTLPDCELVMAGEGHKGWLSSIHFHPLGSHLATASGDNTIKIWELAQARCMQTFTDHTLAVWYNKHFAADYCCNCNA
jgi:regulator of replication initiation timing